MEFLIAPRLEPSLQQAFICYYARDLFNRVRLTLLTYATNFFIFATGRVVVNKPDIIVENQQVYADPLPQLWFLPRLSFLLE